MNEITSKQKLLNKNGTLANPGYAKHMLYAYDRSKVKCAPLRLKEWDFYQIHFGHIALQITMGHISFASSVSATLIDLDTGKRRTVGRQIMFNNVFADKMPQNPEVPNKLQFFSDNLLCQFETTDKDRRLSLTSVGRKGLKAEIDVMLTNCSVSKDKMVIATPFVKKRQWYLNYKENCFVVNGRCRIDDMSYEIHSGFGLLDWGRGVWPYSHSWVWGNGGTVVDGKHFGFNIGWGFGDTSHATENMFFYDNKAYKLGKVNEMRIGDDYRYTDEDGRFVFDVEMLYDNYTATKAVIVNNSCHQRFGLWCGYVVLDDGQRLYVPPFLAFCEHAKNRW